MLDVHCTPNGSDSFIGYTHRREFGKAKQCDHQRIIDNLTAKRTFKPLVADTPINCRSTYLLRLNSTGRFVAAAHGDRSVGIYCSSTGRLLAKCIGHERSPWTLAFHPSHPYLLASGCLGGTIRLWNLESLSQVMVDNIQSTHEFTCVHVWKHTGAIASLAFHPVHPILVVAWTQEVVFYDWVSGRMLSVWRFVSNQSRVRWVKFAPDGALLYTATANPSSYDESGLHQSGPVGNSMTKPNQTPEMETKFANCDTSKLMGHRIPRHLLLEFLIRRSDSWYQNLGICAVCSVRLCRWAGTFGPEFPTTGTDLQYGMRIALKAAGVAAASASVANMPLSHVIRELLSSQTNDEPSQIYDRLRHDANPASVAIIEDVPVHEFLLSRGNYCQTSKSTVSEDGFCCGGHARDLVITHRELMRHSLCRSCLSEFWLWANKHVRWWDWSQSITDAISNTCTPHPSFHVKSHCIETGGVPIVDKAKDVEGTDESITNMAIDSTVGVCIQCRAKMFLQLHSDSDRLSPSKNDITPYSDSLCAIGRHDDSKVNQPLIPLAALDLLQSRLSNAYDVTPITYLASDLIAEGRLVDYIKELLLSPRKDSDNHNVPKIVLDLPNYLTTVGSQMTKRRRIITEGESMNSDLHQTSKVVSPPVASTDLDCNCSQSLHFAQDAANLGHYMRSSVKQHWNYAQPALIRQQCLSLSDSSLKLFPYVSLGSRLLRTPFKPKVGVTDEIMSEDCTKLSSTPSEYQTFDVSETHNDNFMTACCRCGRIVPRTFPIDPRSSLSAVVCEKLMLSDGQYFAANSSSTSLQNVYRQNHCMTTQHVSEQPISLSVAGSGSLLPKRKPQSKSDKTKSNSSGNMFYLIDQTSGNSMLNIVNRSITEVIAGLFVDMGEYGSANNLQDTTYRICRWELSLCGPVKNVDCTINPLLCNPNSEGGGFSPMPANIAVSYNTNSLVIPHARLFNDSSICLSPDGRMLAAFVVPRRVVNRYYDNCAPHRDTKDALQCHTLSCETILAIYRLQPKQRRGQCLFARRFVESNPVCLDFSPLGDFLAVGLATTRLPSESYSSIDPQTSHHDIISYRNSTQTTDASAPFHASSACFCNSQTSIACILHLERVVKDPDSQNIERKLRNLIDIKHPSLLNPVSSRYIDIPDNSTSRLDRWHRLLLSTPDGLSLNTIAWNPNGNILYGTTKGLIVIMRTHTEIPVTILPLDCSQNSSITVEECDKISRKQKANPSVSFSFCVSESNQC